MSNTSGSNYYQTLKRNEKERRVGSPGPEFGMGSFLPQFTTGRTLLGVGEGWDKKTVLEQGVRTWFRLSFAEALRAADVVGMEKLLNEVEKLQSKGTMAAAEVFRRELGVTTRDMLAINTISAAGTSGCGFDWHRVAVQTSERMMGVADGCPIINSVREMGLGDSPALQELSLWCDTYDNFETRATRDDAWFTHTHCLGRGDKLCQFLIDFRPPAPAEENWYQTMKRLRDEKRAEEPDSEKYFVPGYWAPRIVEQLSQEDLLATGVTIQRRIAVGTALIAAELVGWEKWIDGMADVIGPRITERVLATGTTWGVTGNTALDASLLMHLALMGCGFDDHQVTSWTPERVEGVARSCPLIESAKDLEMEDRLGDMCTWCSALGNFATRAVNKDMWVTYTHCLAKGDKLCRWVIQKSE